MTKRLILQFDDDVKFQQILNLAKRLKVPYKFDFIVPTHQERNNVIWHWNGCEIAELSLEAFANDWNSVVDKVWDTI